ncbi:hypothetical protein MMJ63_20320, partial [Bacillus vallismortis]|nr:hypothetical protein [Bacillus vallismortis]
MKINNKKDKHYQTLKKKTQFVKVYKQINKHDGCGIKPKIKEKPPHQNNRGREKSRQENNTSKNKKKKKKK